MDINFIALI
jgi:hypothetical protein